MVAANTSHAALLQAFASQAEDNPGATAYTWTDEHGKEVQRLTHCQVVQAVHHMASKLQSLPHIKGGDTVLLLYPPGLDFILTMWACFHTEAIAVPVFPPNPEKLRPDLEKLQHLVDSCKPTVVLCSSSIMYLKNTTSLTGARWPVGAGCHWIATDAWLKEGLDAGHVSAFGRSALASLIPWRNKHATQRTPQVQLNNSNATSKQPPNPIISPLSPNGCTHLGALPKDEHEGRHVAVDLEKAVAVTTGCGEQMRAHIRSQVAYLQYTSGSTSEPKGVIITYDNLMANLSLLHTCMHVERGKTNAVFWVPQYHDMGLVSYIAPMAWGTAFHGMSPVTFMRNPIIWLQTISRVGGTNTGSPNFGYHLAAKKWRSMSDDKKPHLDLSTVVNCINGAEPINPETLSLFLETFAPCGFKSGAMNPSYGLAESVVLVSCMLHGTGPVIDPVTGRVGCGIVSRKEFPDLHIAIVDPDTSMEVTKEGVIGEVWVAGNSKAAGYWGKEALSEEVFRARLAPATSDQAAAERDYLRTGDLGYIKAGILYVCGRIKDVIIVGGRNYYPHDVELHLTTQESRLRPGCVAVVSYPAPASKQPVVVSAVSDLPQPFGNEDGSVAVVAELRPGVSMSPEAAQKLCTHLAGLVQGSFAALTVVKVLLIGARTIPKTTSGKLQRNKIRQLLMGDLLKPAMPGGLWVCQGTPTSSFPSASTESFGLAVPGSQEVDGWCKFLTALPTSCPSAGFLVELLASLEPHVKDDIATHSTTNDQRQPQQPACELAARMLSAYCLQLGARFHIPVDQTGLPSMQMHPLLDSVNAAIADCDLRSVDGSPLQLSMDEMMQNSPSDVVAACCKIMLGEVVNKHGGLGGAADVRVSIQVIGSVSQSSGRRDDTGEHAGAPDGAKMSHGSGDTDAALRLYRKLESIELPSFTAGAEVLVKPSLMQQPDDTHMVVPSWLWHIMQLLGSCLVWVLLCTAILPSYHYMQYLNKHTESLGHPWVYIKLNDSGLTYWGLLVPVVIVLWISSYSLMVVLLKWVLIGRYRAGCIPTRTLAFYRWWLVDRCMDMWHFIIGKYMGGTLWSTAFYKLMGAAVAWSTKVDAPLTEFDLLTIGPGGEVSGKILCRCVLPGRVVFAPVTIGARVKTHSWCVVEMGSQLSNGCVVHDLAVVPEAAIIHEGEEVKTNPGVVTKEHFNTPALTKHTIQVVNHEGPCDVEACTGFAEDQGTFQTSSPASQHGVAGGKTNMQSKSPSRCQTSSLVKASHTTLIPSRTLSLRHASLVSMEQLCARSLTLPVMLYVGMLSGIPVGVFWQHVSLPDFRYAPVLYILTMFMGYGITIVALNVALKWVVLMRLIRPGLPSSGFWVDYLSWVSDYLGTLAYFPVVMWLKGPLAALYLRLLGARISLMTSNFVNVSNFSPSTVHLLSAGEFLFCSYAKMDFSDDLSANLHTTAIDVPAGPHAKRPAKQHAKPVSSTPTSKYTAVRFGSHCNIGAMVIVGPDVDVADCFTVGAGTHLGHHHCRSPATMFGNPPRVVPSKLPSDLMANKSFLTAKVAKCVADMALWAIFLAVMCAAVLIPAYEVAVALLFSCPDFWKQPAGCSMGSAPLNRNLSIPLVGVSILAGSLAALLFLKATIVCCGMPLMAMGSLDIWSWHNVVYTKYTLSHILPTILLRPWLGSEMTSCVLRLLGASVGRDVLILSPDFRDIPLLTFEDGAVVDVLGYPSGHPMDGIWQQFSAARMCKNSVLQTGAVLWLGGEIGSGSTLGPISLCAPGCKIPEGQHWQGCPAAARSVRAT